MTTLLTFLFGGLFGYLLTKFQKEDYDTCEQCGKQIKKED